MKAGGRKEEGVLGVLLMGTLEVLTAVECSENAAGLLLLSCSPEELVWNGWKQVRAQRGHL